MDRMQQSGGLTSWGSDSITTIRIRVADTHRIDPPIPISPALMPLVADTNGSTAEAAANGELPSISLALEKELLANAPAEGTDQKALARQAAVDDVTAFLKAAPASSYQDPEAQLFIDMGFTRAQAALGVAYKKMNNLGDAEVSDFASNLSQLSSMGWPLSVAAGALVRCKNDLNAATELCLALPASSRPQTAQQRQR